MLLLQKHTAKILYAIVLRRGPPIQNTRKFFQFKKKLRHQPLLMQPLSSAEASLFRREVFLNCCYF